MSHKTGPAYSIEVQESTVRSVAPIDEQLLQWLLSSRPMGRGHTTWAPAGERTQTNTKSTKRVVLSSATSDANWSERVVAEPTPFSTNCYCQRFSPETLPHFLKGEDESGLKRRLKCWSAWGGSSGDSVNEKGGDVQWVEVWPCSMFKPCLTVIYLSVPCWKGSRSQEFVFFTLLKH